MLDSPKLNLVFFLAFVALTQAGSKQTSYPNWAIERRQGYLPEYTPIAHKPANYLSSCSPVNCNGKGLCFIVQHELSKKNERVCECQAGSFGSICQFEDVCYHNKSFCANGGKCQMQLHPGNSPDAPESALPSCACEEGTSGDNCERYEDCLTSKDNMCELAKQCIVLPDKSHKCVCPNGVFGEKCDVFESSSPCHGVDCNGGKCVIGQRNQSFCECPDGYEGQRCERKSNVCRKFSGICGNHGSCVSDEALGTWKCVCDKGFVGDFCDEAFKPCVSHKCVEANGICTVENAHKQNCSCNKGYVGDFCEQKASLDCRTRECENGGVCGLKPDGSTQCSCPKEFFGSHCHLDVDECSSGSPEPVCLNGATCENTVNGFKCNCMTGYSGALCEIDNDDCLGDPCYNGAQCVDEGPLKYSCNCPLSQHGEPLFRGHNCQIPNPCIDPNTNGSVCLHNGRCHPSGDYKSYTCSCYNTGYEGDNCEKDIDECVEFARAKKCIEDGHECINTPGSWLCRCSGPPGLSSGRYCSVYWPLCDNDNPCQNGAKCVSKYDLYATGDPRDLMYLGRCECTPGFNGSHCEQDLRCVNTLCNVGEDCIEDEKTGFGKCVCPKGEICGREAIDAAKVADNCAKHPCKNGAKCYNGIDDVFCKCAPGFQGKYCTEDVNECEQNYEFKHSNGSAFTSNSPCLNGGVCSNYYNSYTCKCPTGYTGKNCEIYLDPCTVQRDPKYSPCTLHTTEKCSAVLENNTFTVTCDCKPGFYGSRCQFATNPCLRTQVEYQDDFGFEVLKGGEIDSNLCSGRGICEPVLGEGFLTGDETKTILGHSCACQIGLTGDNCEKETRTCSNDLCNNHGNCSVTKPGSFQCLCSEGYLGKDCSLKMPLGGSEIWTCDEYRRATYGDPPCLNGGECVEGREDTRFKCSCKEGFSGPFCEEIVEDFCFEHRPCRYGNCLNLSDGGYKCECLPGYTGTNCDLVKGDCDWDTTCRGLSFKWRIDVPYLLCVTMPGSLDNECVLDIEAVSVRVPSEMCPRKRCSDDSMYMNDHGCMSGPLGDTCICGKGKFGDYDCAGKLNLCDPKLNPCDPEGTTDCVNVLDESINYPNWEKCVCKDGFKGQWCNETSNVCHSGVENPCKNNATCVPVGENDFKCECLPGFGCKDCSCKDTCTCGGPGECVLMGEEKGDLFYRCMCIPGVGGKLCDVDLRNECEVNPCDGRPLTPGVKGFVCEDNLGFFECVPAPLHPTTASTERAPYVEEKKRGITLATILISCLAALVLFLLLILVLKGSKGTKIVVQKTYYPSGWLEIIKGAVGRKRARDDPAGQYEMSTVGDEGEYYSSEYSEVGNARKKLRQGENVSPRVFGREKVANELNKTSPGCKVLVAGADNTTSAMLVLKNRDSQVRRQTLMDLVQSGFDLNTQTLSRHETVLHQAILLSDIESVQILLQSPSIDLNISDINNRNALMVATAAADECIFEIICRLSSREMINQQQMDGTSALMAAAKFTHSTVILRRLIDAGADVNLVDKRGRTALHWAAQVGNAEGVVLLINAKADRDAQDVEECTPLVHAVREGCEESVLKLLEMGVDRSVENRDKQTALDIAQLYENKTIIHFLQHVIPIMAPPDMPQKKNSRKNAKQNKILKQSMSKKRPEYVPVMPTAILDPSGHPIPHGMNVINSANMFTPVQCNPRMQFNQQANIHVNPNFASPVLSQPTPNMNGRAQQPFLLTPANNGAQCQTIVLTDPSGRFFQESPQTSMHGGVFPVATTSMGSDRQITCQIATPIYSSQGVVKNEFCDNWSETIPPLEAKNESCSLEAPSHRTQVSVYEEDGNYEKINYDYASLPKVASTSSLHPSQHPNPIITQVGPDPATDCSKMLQVSTGTGTFQTPAPVKNNPVMFNNQLQRDQLFHLPGRSGSGAYLDMSRGVQAAQQPQGVDFFASNYLGNSAGRNGSTASGIDSVTYDFNNPMYHSNSLIRNHPGISAHGTPQHFQMPIHLSQSANAGYHGGYDRVYSAPNGYAFADDTAVAHF